MNKWIVAIALVTTAVIVWTTWVRPRLCDKPWAKPFFDWIEPLEILLWRKSEAIMMARWTQLTGALLAFLISIQQIDLTWMVPFLPDKLKWLPSAMPLLISVLGWINERQRVNTTLPIQVVEQPKNAPAVVQEAVAAAKEMRTEAVETIKAAEAAPAPPAPPANPTQG